MSGLESKKNPTALWVGLAIVLLGAGGTGIFMIKGSDAPVKKKAASVVMITPLPPPVPPPITPPPTEPPPPVEQKMIEQEPVVEEEKPPEAPAPEQPPSDLTTNLKGDGANSFGLSQGNGRGGNGQIGGTGNGGGGSKFGYYASGVQSAVSEAMRRHPVTRNASFPAIKVRVWPDATGRITRAQLIDSTGSSATDEALKNQILTGLQLRQPPPADMPLPIVMRLAARKP